MTGAVVLRNRNVSACVFPPGTANLLFANIGNSPEPAALARACRVGHTACIDLGEISWLDERGVQHVKGFGLMSGTGFDAQLMEAALPNKAAMGQAAFLRAQAFANPRPTVEEFTIIADGQEYHRRGISCMVADNAMMQGDIQMCPTAGWTMVFSTSLSSRHRTQPRCCARSSRAS